LTIYTVPDDVPDVLSAWNACVDGAGDEAYVREGSYILNPVAKWPPNFLPMKQNTKLRGDGLDKTIINMTIPGLADANRWEMLQSLGTVKNFTVEDIGFDMNSDVPSLGVCTVGVGGPVVPIHNEPCVKLPFCDLIKDHVPQLHIFGSI